MNEKILKVSGYVLLTITVLIADIWLITPLVEAYNILNNAEVMMGGMKADLSIVGDMFVNPLISLKKLGQGSNITKWFFISLVIDTFFIALLYITTNKNSKQVTNNGKTINYSRTNGTYGTAQWMSSEELNSKDMRKLLDTKSNKGILYGRLDENPKVLVTLPPTSYYNRNVAVFGSSGSKKSRAYVRPTAMNLTKLEESMIFTDPKGELFQSLAPFLESEGYDVKCFNLVNMPYSDRWNPLSEVKDDLSAQTFAQVIIDNTSDGNSAEKTDFWTRTETNLLKALALYVVLEIPEEEANMATLYSLVSSRDVKRTEEIFKRLPDDHPALPPYNIYKQATDAVRTGAVIGLGTRLQVFQSKLVQKLTEVSDINLTMPGIKKCAYFCIISDMESTFDFLSGLFFSFLFIKLIKFADSRGGKCKKQVNFILDEFPNIAKIPDFEKKMSTIRSRGISASVIFQNISQFQNRYDKGKWSEILDACDTQLFLGCNEIVTAEYISTILGTATIEDFSVSKQQGLEGLFDFGRKTDKLGKRNLLNPDEVKRFDNNKAILILKGKDPLILRKFDYEEHRLAKKLKEKLVREYKKEWAEEFRTLEEKVLIEEFRKYGLEEDLINLNIRDIENPDVEAKVIEAQQNAIHRTLNIKGDLNKNNIVTKDESVVEENEGVELFSDTDKTKEIKEDNSKIIDFKDDIETTNSDDESYKELRYEKMEFNEVTIDEPQKQYNITEVEDISNIYDSDDDFF
ncbi:type IV secretory system Conjugative DNA transfer family protein [Clostridium argentinense CDC 2741]|uniref:Type IV secretory system Conjugative DNA transfer family protein n=2 Tax=Clostridium argentinense TaxID=29341 RepID=A0A0C1TW63_9CLOT|nr:type IV secretory system conjugative DNA transfer family protein [Clostridium argentinense]ARC83183.1 hypothetical protein RSJ17_00615 [Clostridium argentinense]KIE44954.1 type IV secretory system Conjugative DNA transfer family protein [Clostridium argentinense CDC 2741]NFF41428.1 conjugal transfer protein TraG [Clostridium argentinense]NFP52092.1 conjugal transfer protein TraG [Clostridium argentinense]NFP74412.1 conjugal transfer protein TraG [Clostridium argentinense]